MSIPQDFTSLNRRDLLVVAEQLKQQLSERTTAEMLMALYKSQFQWALEHRNSIYQRVAILVSFVGIFMGLLGVAFATSNRLTFEHRWAVVLQSGVGLLVFAAIPWLMVFLRSKGTGVGRLFTTLDTSSVEALDQDLLVRHRILANENIRLTRRVRQSFNIFVTMVILAVFLIAISMYFTVPL